VRSHKEFIETLFKRILKGIDLEIENFQLQQSDFDKNDEQLNDEIKKLDDQIINIENENKKLDFKMREIKK
jgi:peptidoglycan hydrolase CwlO-like protein